jgi:hypothetical protein
VVLPFLGVFIYVIARGSKMAQHAEDAARAQDQAMRAYIRDTVNTPASPPDQLTSLQSLRDQGVIDNEEYERMSARVNPA